MSLVNVPILGNPEDLSRQLRSNGGRDEPWRHLRRRPTVRGADGATYPSISRVQPSGNAPVGVPREYSRSREEQNRERRNTTLPRPVRPLSIERHNRSTRSQRKRTVEPRSANSSISVDRRVVLQPPSVMSILRRHGSPLGARAIVEPPRSLRRTTTRLQADSYRQRHDPVSDVRVEWPSREHPRLRTLSEPNGKKPPRIRTTSETSRNSIASTKVARSRTASGSSSHPPTTPPPRYSNVSARPFSRQAHNADPSSSQTSILRSQSDYRSQDVRKPSLQQSTVAAPRAVTWQASPLSKVSRSPRSPNLIELVRRLSKKRVRFRSVSSRRTISSHDTPPGSPARRPARVLRRMPSSARLATSQMRPSRSPSGRSRSPPPYYQPIPVSHARSRLSAQPPNPQEPSPVYPSRMTRTRTAHMPSPSDARSTTARAVPPLLTTPRSRSRSVHRISSSTYLAPSRSSTRLRSPILRANPQRIHHAPSSPRSIPASPHEYDKSDPPTPRTKRRFFLAPFTKLGNVSLKGWTAWRNRKRSQEHAAFVDLPLGMKSSDEHFSRRKGLGLFRGMSGGVPWLRKDPTYRIPVLHPFLRASSLLRAPHIIWDMRHHKLPREYSLSPFVHKSLQESAVQPPSNSMTILIPNPTRSYWSTVVYPRSGSHSITCVDILRAAALLLRNPATPSEFADLRSSDQRLAERAFNVRCQAGEDMGQREEERERRIGLRKVDLLGRNMVWKGLRRDKGGRGWVVALGETWI